MDLVSILIMSAVIALCALPFIVGAYRSLDRKATDFDHSDEQTAKALRDARTDIDRGKGYYGP